MTHPIESQAAALAFELHPAVAKSIFRDGWMLTVTDGDGVTHKLDQNLVLLRSSEKHMVFETRTKVKGCWVRMRARFTSRSPWVLFWIWPIMGDESMPEPSISPGPLTLEANRDPIVHPITLTGFSSYLHGQGAGITQVQFNFDHFSAEPTFPHEHSDYAPYHPNQTGGEWPYMGISFPAGIPHGQLYAVGSYGGHFLRPDGSFTAELDHPHLQADSHIHEHSDDKGWIRYTYPATPWRDRLLGFQANQDDQHYCLFRPVAQTLRRSDDEGLRMLCEAAAHVFLRQIPDSPRGTTHHLSGAERAQGRILLTGCDLFEALLPTSRELANLVGVRTLARSRKDMTAFQERQADGEPDFAH